MNRFSREAAFFLLLLLGAGVTAAAPVPREIRIPVRTAWAPDGLNLGQEPAAPRLALALSGGGLRGLAHIGALKSLEQAGIMPYAIAGVSFGALVAGLYCEGFTPDEIAESFRQLNLESMLEDEPERRSMILARKQELSRHLLEIRLERDFSPILPGAITPGQSLYQHLLDQTLELPDLPLQVWNELPIKYAVIATDLNSGNPIVFRSGDPAIAIRASMAVPLLLDPLALDTLQLIDGGIFTNIPVELARDIGGDVVLAVDVSAELHDIKPPYQPWLIVDQVTTILEQDNIEQSLYRADVALKPNISVETPSLEWYRAVLDSGAAEMERALPRLRELLELPALPDDSMLIRVDSITGLKPTDESLIIDSNNLVTLRAVRELIRRRFNSGAVCDVWAEFDESNGALSIKETLPKVVNEVLVQGDSSVSSLSLKKQLSALVGEPLTPKKLNERIRAAHRCLRQAGYPLARLRVKSWDEQTGALLLQLEIGLLDSVVFTGLHRLKPHSLVYETPLVIGEPVKREKIVKAVKSLYATGLFRNVISQIVPSDIEGRWRLVFHVQEQPPPIRLGLAYLSEKRTQGFVEYSFPWRPVFPTRTVLFASVGELNSDYHFSFHIDKVSRWPIIADVTVGYADRERSVYSNAHQVLVSYFDSRWGASVELGGLAHSWGLLALTMRLEEHCFKYKASVQQYHLAAVGAKVGLDTQDRYPYPKRGFRLDSAVESAGQHLASDVSFNRLWGSAESYFPLAKRYTLGLHLAGGTADRTTPRDEQFRLGGIHQFPGLHLDEKVGLIQTNGGAELRYDLLSQLLADAYWGIRVDAGGNWQDPGARLKRENLLTSFSVYFALDTILGPIHLQWGHLNPNRGIPHQNLFYIQAGNLF